MFYRLLIPGTLAAIPYSIGDTVDAVIIGNSVGTTGLATLGICNCIYIFYNIIMLSLGLGGASQFSALMGKNDTKGAEKCFNDTFKFTVLIGLLIMAAGLIFIDPLIRLLGATADNALLYTSVKRYLEVTLVGAPIFFGHAVLEFFLINDNKQGLANTGSVVGSFSNIFLSIFMVVYLKMGTLGAAVSMVTSQLLAVLCYVPALMDKNSQLHFTDWKIDLKRTVSCFRSGLSVNITYFYQTLFLIVMNKILMNISGENGVSIFEITQNIFYIFMYIGEGNSRAVQPLISTYLSEKNYTGIQYIKRMGMLCNIAVEGAIAAAGMLFPQILCLIFGYSDASSMQEAYFVIRIYLLSSVIAGIYTYYINYYQAINMEKRATLMNTIRGIFCVIPCVILFSIILPENIWYFFPVSELLALGIHFALLKIHKEPDFHFDPERIFSKTIKNTESDLLSIAHDLEMFGKKLNLNPKQLDDLSLATEELGEVMLKYAFRNKKDGYIHISIIVEEDETITFCMRDTAEKFNPFSLETLDKIKQTANFYYRYFQGFNTTSLKFETN